MNLALAYPWQSTRDYVLLGVAAAVVIGLFGFWRGCIPPRSRAAGGNPAPPTPDCRARNVHAHNAVLVRGWAAGIGYNVLPR